MKGISMNSKSKIFILAASIALPKSLIGKGGCDIFFVKWEMEGYMGVERMLKSEIPNKGEGNVLDRRNTVYFYF